MSFESVESVAQRWRVSPRSVRNYAAQGRIPGAVLDGKTWKIPEGATKPMRKNGIRRDVVSPVFERLRQEKRGGIKGGLYHRVQVQLTYSSNRIEGSRLSLEQTRHIFETATVGLDADGVPVDDIVETMNHFRAIDFVIENADQPVTEAMIKELHLILKSSTTAAQLDWFAVGDYKKLPNEVAGRVTTAPEDVATAVSGLVKNMRLHAVLEEIVADHVAFERIHPFQDGNGRVGRLLMFKECLRNDVVPFIITDDLKLFYYRGLSEWDEERGFLLETCREAQDRFRSVLDYFACPATAGDHMCRP